MANRPVNLYSDTQTHPTPAMRQAIAQAPVGDEQRGEDPSVNALCERVADLLGKEQAVFMPSGTMCNELAIKVHCQPGDEVLAEATSHIIHFEGGGPAALSGVMVGAVTGDRGIYSGEALSNAIHTPNRYAPRSRLVAVEQTANMAGGTVWPLSALQAVAAVARQHDLATHMDGARLPNAVVAAGVSFADFAREFDTVWIDLSKGLGCPVGAVLAGSADVIERVWAWKQRIGGAMRQAGILAAAGLHALDHHVERLAEDHANAKRLAEAIAEIPELSVDPGLVETNMVFFEVEEGLDATKLCAALKERDITMGAMGERRIRAVTHLDVDVAGIDYAVKGLREILKDERMKVASAAAR